MTSHWEFYQQTSICIPLPVTRQYFKGFAYSFGVFIVLNSVLFLLIAAGQAFIYHSIKMNSISMADTTKSSTRELAIARRLITRTVPAIQKNKKLRLNQENTSRKTRQ